MKSLNVNAVVEVRLTASGREIINRRHEEFLNSITEKARERWKNFTPAEANEDGYSTFQLWNLMNIFGPYIDMAVEPPFETIILIEEGELRDVV